MLKDISYLSDFMRSIRQNMNGLQTAIQELAIAVKADVSSRPTFEEIQRDIIMRNGGLQGELADQFEKVLEKDPSRLLKPPNTERNQLKVTPLVKLNTSSSKKIVPPAPLIDTSLNTERMLVSEDFFQKMYLTMKNEQIEHFGEIERKIQRFYEKCDRFVKISDVEFPKVKKVSERACAEGMRVNKALHVEIVRKSRMRFVRDVWVVLKKNRQVQRRKDEVRRLMLKHFRNQYMYIFMKRWRRKTYVLRELNRKDSLAGAQFQLDHFKSRLDSFTGELAKIEKSKLNVDTFEATKNDFRHNHVYVVYNEMKSLFETTITKFKKQVKEIIHTNFMESQDYSNALNKQT